MNNAKVWYVTGASQGWGLILVKKLLTKGYRVAATSRNADALRQAVGPVNQGAFLHLPVDITSREAIGQSVQETLAAFGRIDVAVNNAGYGMAGTLEEAVTEDIRRIFEINVLATMEVVKQILPAMRRQGCGHIINMGSAAGFAGAPGWAVYSATKAAVTAFSEVLALDVEEFGIKVTVLEPSGFRTGFLSKDSLAYTESKLEGYQAVKNTQKRYLATSGIQAGDPERASDILIALAESDAPPIHLFLGLDAYHRAFLKINTMSAELEQWKSTTIASDFPSDNLNETR